ncbi:helix-turn-helix domain-containing protein, partial [Enterococcus faecalis]|nr:helix-turn-helix domain-containing protein [Enterococcus faecalis]
LNKNNIYFSQNIKDEEYTQLLYYIREKYLLSSSLYQSLLFVLEQRSFSVIDIACSLSYSESYTYKLISKLNTFFCLVDIGIKINKKNKNTLYLSGDEVVIRLLQYLLINIVSTKDSWHFQTILESQTEILHSFANSNRTKRFSCTNLKRVKVIIAVYEIAIRRGDLSSALPSSVRSVGRIINKEKEIYVYLNYLRKRELGETRELYEELLQLAFIINYFTQELRTKNEKIKLGKELVKNSENPIIKPCVGLINRICKKYKLSESSYYLLA